ncbi:MAG: DUF2225 domain-containing protein [Cyclobacteriaceae bacterium]
MRLVIYLTALLLSVINFAQQKEIDSIKFALPKQEPLDQVKSLNELSWYYKNSNLDSSLLLAKQALAIGQKLESKAATSQSYNSLANVYEAKGLLDSALIFHKNAFALKKELGDSLGMASSLNNQGITYDELGNYPKSLESYFQSLKIYELKSEEPYDIAMVLGNIGIVYKKQKEFEKVLSYYQRALSIYDEVNSSFGQTVTKGNIGGVLLLMGDYDGTIKYAEEALEGYRASGYTRYIPYQLGNIGAAYDSLGQTLKARELYKQSEELHESHQNLFELANTLSSLAGNFRKTKDFGSGVAAARKALNYARQVDAKEFEAKALFELSRNLEGSKEYRQAIAALTRYTALRDSLSEETKTKQIFELQTQYETEKKEQQIIVQNAQLSEQESEIKRNQLLLYFSLFAILLLAVIVFLWRNRLEKKQQIQLQDQKLAAQEAEINATISSQEKERARYARDLHDGFGQMISILNMNLNTLRKARQSNENQQLFSASTEVVDGMYKELNSICFDLMPQTLIKHGLGQALVEFASRVNQSKQDLLEINTFGLESRLSEIQEISLYRISQEWINNTLKYSDADNISLQITRDENEVTLLIEDNGSGFDKSLLLQSQGYGWKNMNIRAKIINGVIELETTAGKKGSTLILNAPSNHQGKGTENTVSMV